MGTRADFYVGRGPGAEWIGSTAWDGYPDGIAPKRDAWAPGHTLFDAVTDRQFRDRVAEYFAHRDDVTLPAQGWPWPWDDSQTTDYAYAFDLDRVWASCFGHAWFDPRREPPDDESEPALKPTEFPNMKARQRVTFGARSGVIVIGANGPEKDLP